MYETGSRQTTIATTLISNFRNKTRGMMKGTKKVDGKEVKTDAEKEE